MPLGTPFIIHQEHDVALISGFIALDTNANVLGLAPTNAPTGTGPYTMCKGVSNAIAGTQGVTKVQPHISPGQYVFTLDTPYIALLYADAILLDPSAANPASLPTQPLQGYQPLNPHFRANVRATNTTTTTATNGPRASGVDPGTDNNLTVQTVNLYWRVAAGDGMGSLADPPPNSGFWLWMLLKRSAIY